MSKDKVDCKNLSLTELENLFSGWGEPPFRATQLLQWIYKKKVHHFNEMSNFSYELRQKLSAFAYLSSLKTKKIQTSSDGTQKFLFELEDGETIETVLMPHRGRNTVCISTQVGCRMKCKFCLTAKQGLIRHLKVSEILNQLLEVQLSLRVASCAPWQSNRITNVVMMGMGEPLDNFTNVISALELMTHPHGLELAPRRITVSTVGLAHKIAEFGKKTNVNLALSLNASSNEVRTSLMPMNKAYPIERLLEEIRSLYKNNKKRKIMLEYILMDGITDSDEDAYRLVKLLKGFPFKINLIPFNSHSDLTYREPPLERIDRFQEILKTHDIFSFIRWSKGRDVSAACGQLRSLHPTQS
ncbi:MAG: 23S rRNA (adenine(2503)-C(2))-methyltransferase RlmN [Deltaproteobacteria bacterium]|nr:23S rRNA (adenine(2503)-C(2))-methyltransferase RlmN [Deltaproteobacteria bacterium]